MSRVAAIDCGTNSIRLLLADVEGPRLLDVSRRMEIVRLGQGVDRTGMLAPEALRRTVTVLRDYAARISAAGATAVRMVATSATRDARNNAEFVRIVHEVLGIEPEVISGEREAELSFAGATRELAGRHDVATPYLAVDIGGGSTEFVLGDRRPDACRSVDIGSVRLTERHLRDDPPTGRQVAAARADVAAALDEVAGAMPIGSAGTVLGLAGTVTTIAGIALDLPGYDADRTHHTRLDRADVQRVTERLLTATHAQRAAIAVMHPGRADVIGGGALILDGVMARTGAREVLVSEHDILDGIAWSMA